MQMIDKTYLTPMEQHQLKMLVLEKKKEQLEKEIEETKLKAKGFKDAKALKELGNYFTD